MSSDIERAGEEAARNLLAEIRPTPKNTVSKRAVSLVRKIVEATAEIKRLYEETEEHYDELLEELNAGDIVVVEGKLFELVDNYAKQNTVFRTCAIKRFELKEVKVK